MPLRGCSLPTLGGVAERLSVEALVIDLSGDWQSVKHVARQMKVSGLRWMAKGYYKVYHTERITILATITALERRVCGDCQHRVQDPAAP